jgi:hypothetical protein
MVQVRTYSLLYADHRVKTQELDELRKGNVVLVTKVRTRGLGFT